MAITVYTYNDKVLKNVTTDKWLKKKEGLPPIPANSIRVRTSDGNVPYKAEGITNYTTATLVTGTTDVYDVYKSGSNFNQVLCKSNNVTEVLGANITSVTNISNLFAQCTSLITVQLFDISNATNMQSMFNACSSLTSIPLFDTSSATNVSNMFYGCTNVESGALALYQQASTQTMPPSSHSGCFSNCGSSTTTGAAELAQIPSSWGGTAS